jgi:putative mRNA 3-end processing factor
VKVAVVTHAHADRTTFGCQAYYCAEPCAPLLRQRLGPHINLKAIPYGVKFTLGATVLSFHPAGHILGSAQVRIESGGEVWVVSGDYKRDFDPTCAAFEVVPCDVFVSEATYALPVYQWRAGAEVVREIHSWWQTNQARDFTSLLFCSALGKAQRILAELSPLTGETVYTHGILDEPTEIYRRAGVTMPPTEKVIEARSRHEEGKFARALVLAPPSAMNTPWMKRFRDVEMAGASGALRVRGSLRLKGWERGFVLSDHADWPGLLRTVRETGAKKVLFTRGYADMIARYLREQGVDAKALRTEPRREVAS